MATGSSGSEAQIYVEREGLTSQGTRTVQALKATTVKTDSDLVLTKHEYIEVEAGSRYQSSPAQSQSIQAGSVVNGTQRAHIPIRQVDDDTTCLVCCAVLMAFLSFGSLLCGIPAAILACKALASWSEDPENSRSSAKNSILCSVFGIAVLIAAVALRSNQG